MAACMEIRKTCGVAMAALACILAVATAAAAAAVPARIDWRSAHEFARGMRHVHLSLTVPRRMEADLVRVDMRTPGLRVAGSGRSPEWGKPMPDFRKSGIPIDVRRVKTGDFLAAHRRDGTNMVLAVNTSPWRPWTKPFTHKYGNMHNLTVSGGQVVSHSRKRTGMIVVSDDNKARVADALDDMEIPRTSIAHPGLLGTIMRDGAPTESALRAGENNLAPRTAIGTSADGRWLYILVVDGRQPEWSLGASMRDLADILKAAGAADAVNMDGGGSSTLVLWNAAEKRAETLNRHDAARSKYRPVAVSMGFYFDRPAARPSARSARKAAGSVRRRAPAIPGASPIRRTSP